MDDSDDPVMALLATQRAVLAAVENLAGQVEAMQAQVDAMGETLAQLVAAGTAGASGGGVDRVMTLGNRFRAATAEEAAPVAQQPAATAPTDAAGTTTPTAPTTEQAKSGIHASDT